MKCTQIVCTLEVENVPTVIKSNGEHAKHKFFVLHYTISVLTSEFLAKQERERMQAGMPLFTCNTLVHEQIKAYSRARSSGVLPLSVFKLTSQLVFVTMYFTTSRFPHLKWYDMYVVITMTATILIHNNTYY